jgi:hypothetical protein
MHDCPQLSLDILGVISWLFKINRTLQIQRINITNCPENRKSEREKQQQQKGAGRLLYTRKVGRRQQMLKVELQ